MTRLAASCKEGNVPVPAETGLRFVERAGLAGRKGKASKAESPSGRRGSLLAVLALLKPDQCHGRDCERPCKMSSMPLLRPRSALQEDCPVSQRLNLAVLMPDHLRLSRSPTDSWLGRAMKFARLSEVLDPPSLSMDSGIHSKACRGAALH